MMLTQKQVDDFNRDGYILIPGVIDANTVKWLREFLKPKFELPADQRKVGDTHDVLTDIYVRYEELRWLLFHEPIVGALKSIVGDDYVITRGSCAHLNRFGGWHKDTTTQEMNGWNYVKEKDFLMVESAIYLQDNCEEYGGGLDVEPGSHKKPDPFVGVKGVPHWARDFVRKSSDTTYFIQDGERFIKKPYTVPSKAGDLLIFNQRINHRATPHKLELPAGREKIAIFGAFTRNNRHAKTHDQFLRSRPDPDKIYEFLKTSAYPQDMVSTAKNLGVTLI